MNITDEMQLTEILKNFIEDKRIREPIKIKIDQNGQIKINPLEENKELLTT